MKTQYKDHTLTLYSTTLAGDEHMVSVSFWYKVLSQSKESWKGHYAIVWIRTICIFLKVAVPDKIGRRTTLQVLFTHSLEIKKKKKRKFIWNEIICGDPVLLSRCSKFNPCLLHYYNELKTTALLLRLICSNFKEKTDITVTFIMLSWQGIVNNYVHITVRFYNNHTE